MRRREFITLLGGAAATWPLAARAQQRALPIIGFLSSAAPGPFKQFVEAFQRGLNEKGFIEGQNATIESIAGPKVTLTGSRRSLPIWFSIT
jgi:putative tryptophan/tyrosine transport system substrate-binding protein